MQDEKRKKLMMVAGAVAVVGIFVVTWKMSAPAGPRAHEVRVDPSPTPLATSSIVAAYPDESRLSYGSEERATQSYAIAAAELSGLPPDATPGTRLRIWVAWEPPITDTPEIRILLDSVELEKLIPPITPEGPVTALLSVDQKQISDLLYGDRYGALSVTVLE